MLRMPLLSVVLYLATRLWLVGGAAEGVDESMLALFVRAGLHLTSREILASDGASGDGDGDGDGDTVH